MAYMSLLLLLGATMVLVTGMMDQRVTDSDQKLRVRINIMDDNIVLKFVHPPNMKLEGYVLGYGSSLFSKHLIPFPEDGRPYQAELDAEPKYLVAVQPIPVKHLDRHCTGKVNLFDQLHPVISSVSPTSVLLSWGSDQKMPHRGKITDECLEDGFYTIRYRECDRKWKYETCPTTDTVIDHLKPNTLYEFGVRSNKEDRSGSWSKVVFHHTYANNKNTPKMFKMRNPLVQPLKPEAPGTLFRPRLALHNLTQPPVPSALKFPGFSATPDAYGSSVHALLPTGNKRPNLVKKLGDTNQVSSFKQNDKLYMLTSKVHPVANKTEGIPATTPITITTSTTTLVPKTAVPRQESWENSDLFQSEPVSDVDAMGKKRFVAPHVVYQTGKKPDEPCSITSSLNFFPEDEYQETNVTAPPKTPPSNLTVVTVEGCPSFIILDWEKSDNDTIEYEVISTAKGPDGEQVSILTTHQTHTTVENLKPESSYEFKVKPKNELGEGPPTEPVNFNTESADPRVNEKDSGKGAIWTQFPFKKDSNSDCNGKQYVKRTWYRKFVGVQLCNSLRYKIYLSDSLHGNFYNIGDQSGFGEDHCQFVDSFLEGRTDHQLQGNQLPSRPGFYRAVRQEPVHFGQIGGQTHISYVSWYECGTPIPGKW